ncbi:MAG: PTS sugar transporter subunit IIC [Clostridia bacterium]|nr:PTS sugar transporter subunit IIC [Clostridia bacterium]
MLRGFSLSLCQHSPMMWAGLVLCCLVLPAVLSLLLSEIMRKLEWIKYGDMKLDD